MEEIDFVAVKDEYDQSDSASSPSVYRSKCGEIFKTRDDEFLLICMHCNNIYNSMTTFGFHILETHKSTNKMLEDTQNVRFESRSMKTESAEELQKEIDHLNTENIDNLRSSRIKTEKGFLSNLESPKDHSVAVEAVTRYETLTDSPKSMKCEVDGKEANRKETADIAADSCGKQKFQCSFCPNTYTRLYNLNKHMCKHTKVQFKRSTELNPSLYCEICNKQFIYKGTFRRHALEHDPLPKAILSDPYYMKCYFCLIEFNELDDWREHENKHGKPTTFICLECPKTFKRDCDLQMHINIHAGRKPFKCDQCPLAFAHKDNLTNHVKRIHLKIMKYTCKVCTKTFVTRTEFDFHKRIHTGEKPFQCETCGNSFRLFGHLQEHRLMHVKRKDYKCPICSAGFYSKKFLKNHMIIHTDMRPFVCNICDRTFNRRTALATHRKLHSSEKNYRCCCGKAFAQAAGLFSHRKHCSVETV